MFTRKEGGPDRSAVLQSVAVHMTLVVAAWAATAFRPPVIEYETVKIQIMSPPAVQAQEVVESTPEEDLEVDMPDPEPEEEPLPVAEEAPPPPPERPREEPRPAETPTEQRTPTTTEEVPEERESGEGIETRLEGLIRDYPEYWNRIIREIGRCFRGSREAHRGTFRFTIHRDGTVSDIDVVESSGSLAFEINAIEAIECAGRGRLGPLPSDFQYETLPVLFSFEPRGR